MSVEWNYFNQFEKFDEQYLPDRGEGDTMATQIVTAVTKLVYKWYNDGDVYDNTCSLCGWCNDLSSYANWLITYIPEKAKCLEKIFEIFVPGEYEDILKELVDSTHNEEYLNEMNKKPKVGTIYKCDGPFEFRLDDDDEDDEEDLW